MQATILKTLLLIALLFGITSSGIARTEEIPLKGEDQDKQKRSISLPLPIIVSISDNQLTLDFLASLGDVIVTVRSESGNVHSINYSIVSAQTVLFALDNVTAYSGDTRSPIPVISVHFLFAISVTGCKISTFFSNFLPLAGI